MERTSTNSTRTVTSPKHNHRAFVVRSHLSTFLSTLKQYRTASAHVIFLAMLCSSLTYAQQRTSPPKPNAKKILLIADNQEHMLTGAPLRSLSSWTDFLFTNVGQRSPLANVGGRLLMREILRYGQRRGAGFVLHLGDAADISCDDELRSVFDALDLEYRDKMWFMTPGNHDGFQSGNFARYQRKESIERLTPTFYKKPPLKGFGKEKHKWYYACQKPDTQIPGSDMPKSQAVKLYFERLERRGSPRQMVSTDAANFKEGREQVRVPCTIEMIEIKPQQPAALDRVRAVARLCKTTPILSKGTTVGQYANFIAQMIDVGPTRIVLLDTSDYYDPNELLYGVLPIAAQRGFLTEKQKSWISALFQIENRTIDRKNVIMAGHHPFAELSRYDQIWIAERAGKYISGHKHTATNFREHVVNEHRVVELNIGSTLDYPPQAVLMALDSDSVKIEAWGAGTDAAWPVKQCIEKKKEWMIDLPRNFYKKYRGGLYVKQVLQAMAKATEKYKQQFPNSPPPFEIPTGNNVGDWSRLENVLNAINGSEGDARSFWACQAYYASKETRYEKSLADRILAASEPGSLVNYGWFRFGSSE